MIGIVNNFHPFSGIGKYAFNLLDRTREMGKDTEMLYLESGDNKIPDRQGVVKVRQKFPYPLANRTLSAYYYFPPRIPGGYDVYHVSSHYLSRVAKFRKPCIVTHLDLAPLLFPRQYPVILRHFVKKMIDDYRHADRIAASSEFTKQELLDCTGIDESLVDVIPLGFDEKLYRPMKKEYCRKKLGLPQDKKIVLNVGSEEPRKNLQLLFDAQRTVNRSMDDVVIVRLGDRSPELEGSRQGLDIMYFNKIPEEQMPLFYNSADIFVFPATYEGGGHAYPPEESIGCGIPTVITPAVAMLTSACHVLEKQTPQELAEVMLSVLGSRSRWKKLSSKALEGSKRFTLTMEAKEACRIYDEVAGV
jgi:glycosyltransferase involved in cell wall biosynthesis